MSSSPESFGQIFKSEKVTSWQKSYINYDELINDIKNIVKYLKMIVEENKNNKIILKNNKAFQVKNNSKVNIFGGVETLLASIKNKNTYSFLNKNENINENQEENRKKEIEEKIKLFFQSLDKEIKKIYIFFSTKEKDIYQKINKKIQNKNNIKNKEINEILKEIDSIKYISELCKQIIMFIYWNIKALKNVLDFFGKSTKTITESLSYIYLKNFLAKNNSDLIYILNFKTLDETILSVEDLSKECEKVINKKKYFQNDREQLNQFNNFKDGIKSNIKDYNNTHENIFKELSEWQKYLNINLELPSSSHNSLFRNTSLTGDFVPSNKTKIVNDNKYLNQNYSNEEIDEYIDDDLNLYKFNKKDKSILKEYNLMHSNSLFKENLCRNFSFSSNKSKILSYENNRNLNIIYGFVFFYTYSYCIIICLLSQGYIALQENKNKYFYLYGIIISLPILGNLLSLIYINILINKHFKLALFLSFFFVVSYYFLVITGIFMTYYEFSNIGTSIKVICIGRFLLGLSSLNLIGKEYINTYIPNQSQIKCNQNYLISTYCGYIISFFLIGIQASTKKEKNHHHNDTYHYLMIGLISLSCIFSFIIGYITIQYFKDPKNKNFKKLSNNFSEKAKKNMIIFNMELEDEDKEIVDEQEQYFQNANNLALLSGVNYLKENTNEIELNKKAYLNKIFIFLIILLCASQYTSENCLIFLSVVSTKVFYNDNHKLGLFGNSASFLISLFLQKIFLRKISQRNLNEKILVFLSIISIIIISLDMFSFSRIPFDLKSFIFIFNSLMIIIADFFKIITVNLFIKLLPFEDFTFLCFKSSNFIEFVNKIIKLMPGLLSLFLFIPYEGNENLIRGTPDNNIEFYNINLGFNNLLFLISLIYLLYYWNLKPNSLSRVLYSTN